MLPSNIRRKLVTECCKEDGRKDVYIKQFAERFRVKHDDEVMRAFDFIETTKSEKLSEHLLSHPTDLIEAGMFAIICIFGSAEVVQEILNCLKTHMLTLKNPVAAEDGDQEKSHHTTENNHDPTHPTDADYSKWPLLMPNNRGRTVLHQACATGNPTVVETLIKFTRGDPRWLTRGDVEGYTALHYSADTMPASNLLESLSPDFQRTLLLNPINNHTALHKAVRSGKPEVAELLIRFSKRLKISEEFIMMADCDGCTALHYASDGHVASLLLDSLPTHLQHKLVLKRDKYERTALHHICGSEDAVEVLLRCAQGMEPHAALLLLLPDIYGDTVLHSACWRGDSATPAKLVLDFVQQFPSKHFGRQFLSKFILSANNRDHSVLHNTMFEDTATLLVKSLQSGADKMKLVTHRDEDGKNILHDAAFYHRDFSLDVSSQWIIKFIDKLMSAENEIPCDTLDKMLRQTENYGDTPIMLALYPGIDTMEACRAFQFIEDVFELLSSQADYEETLKSVLDQRNSKGQTVFHLAALLPALTKIHILKKLVASADIVECTSQWGLTDNFGNLALHYLAGRTDTTLFARLLRNMSLKTRIRLMSQSNRAGVTCMDILNRGRMNWNFFNTSVLRDNKTVAVRGYMAHTSNAYLRCEFNIHPKATPIDEFFDFKRNNDLLLSVVMNLLNMYDIRFSVALNDSADSRPPISMSKLDEVFLSQSHCQTTADKKINSSLVIISHRN